MARRNTRNPYRYADEGDLDRALDYSHRQLQLVHTVHRTYCGARDNHYPDFVTGMGNVAIVLSSRPELSLRLKGVYSRIVALAQLFGLDITKAGDSPTMQSICILKRVIAAFEDDSQNQREPQQRANALSNLGCIYDMLGDREEAMACFGLAETLIDPRERSAVSYNLAACYDDLGDKQKAKEHYQQALALLDSVVHPHNYELSPILDRLGSLLEAQGDKPGALRAYERSLTIKQRHLAAGSLQLARSLDDVAQLRLDALRSGQHEHSAEYLRAILQHLEEALATLEAKVGAEHLLTAAVSVNLGLVKHLLATALRPTAEVRLPALPTRYGKEGPIAGQEPAVLPSGFRSTGLRAKSLKAENIHLAGLDEGTPECDLAWEAFGGTVQAATRSVGKGFTPPLEPEFIRRYQRSHPDRLADYYSFRFERWSQAAAWMDLVRAAQASAAEAASEMETMYREARHLLQAALSRQQGVFGLAHLDELMEGEELVRSNWHTDQRDGALEEMYRLALCRSERIGLPRRVRDCNLV